ncbi:hypothetical protein [Scytonema sp. PRP1]
MSQRPLEGFQRQLPTAGDPPSVLSPPQATGVGAASPQEIPEGHQQSPGV